MRPAELSAPERANRSRLHQLLRSAFLLRGSLTLRQVTCGRKGCHCQGEAKHTALYLTRSKNGRPEQLHVPRAMEPEVRQRVQQYQKARALLERIGDVGWQRVKQQKKTRRKG